jgi:hypothetical protein
MNGCLHRKVLTPGGAMMRTVFQNDVGNVAVTQSFLLALEPSIRP